VVNTELLALEKRNSLFNRSQSANPDEERPDD